MVSTSLISWGTSLVVAMLLAIGFIPPAVVEFLESRFRSIARKQILLWFLIPASSLVVNFTIAMKNGIPRARVQDEFSYLLAADTFSHGRLTNPTPAFWEHFETPHELLRPTYMSKYPPGQGLVLSLGQVSTGLPIVGVWLSTAIACEAIYWMLLGFFSRPWAMLGGIIAVIHPLLIHWSHIYWGGSVAVAGGALVLGSWIRLMQQPSKWSAVFLAIGLSILANSRPFEGLLLAVPLLSILIWTRRNNPSLLIPIAIVLLPVAAMMGYYNLQITGHLLRSPYQQYIQQYDVYPKFWFMPKLPPPVYHDDLMRLFHTADERWDYDSLRTIPGFVKIAIRRSWLCITVHANPLILMLPLVASIWLVKNRSMRWIWITGIIFVMGLWQGKVFLPHYAAPFTAGFFLLFIAGLQQLSLWNRIGQIICRAVVAGFVVGAVIFISAPVDADSKRTGQLELLDQSASLRSGKHLIFVTNTPDHLIHDEWVYNAADIENSRVIWARSLGSQSDSEMIKHFSGRMTWLLTVGKDDVRLSSYPTFSDKQ